jgi:hypothetical protein
MADDSKKELTLLIACLKRFFSSFTGGFLGVMLGVALGGFAMYFYVANFSFYAQKPTIGNVDATMLSTGNSTISQEEVITIPKTMNFMQKTALLWKLSGSEKNVKLEKDSGGKVEEEAKIGVDFYLCEITDFYDGLISTLFSAIGIILGIGFIFLVRTSRTHAEEMARSSLGGKAFKIELKKLVDDEIASNSIPDMIEYVEETKKNIDLYQINDRINFLEQNITTSSYSTKTDGVISNTTSKEDGSDGDN